MPFSFKRLFSKKHSATPSASEPPCITFQVDDVQQQSFRYATQGSLPNRAILSHGEKPEYVHLDDSLASKPWIIEVEKHAFFNLCFTAYNYHRGIVLSADMLLQLILEGLAVHTSKYPEELRSKFVKHEGKQEITLQRDDFVLGSESNNWGRVVDEFCDEIRKRANPDVYDDLVGESFSTTTKTDMVCRQIALMSTVKHYFSYLLDTGCGFPTVTLLGTRDDYVLLQRKIDTLATYMMPELASTWIPALESIMPHFIGVWDGQIDKLFWGSMCKYGRSGGGSFGPSYTRMSGWINILFPYVGEEEEWNPYCLSWAELEAKVLEEKNAGQFLPGLDAYKFTRRFCSAPVIWKYGERSIPLQFKAGFVGGTVNSESGAVTPFMTWAIVHPKKSKSDSSEQESLRAMFM